MKNEKQMKDTQSEIKQNIQVINSVDQKEERNIQPQQNEETRIQKNGERLRNL